MRLCPFTAIEPVHAALIAANEPAASLLCCHHSVCRILSLLLFFVWTQAEKRRETLLVGLSKTKDQLSVAEEKYKNQQLEMQRTQMDLLAKTSENEHLFLVKKL